MKRRILSVSLILLLVVTMAFAITTGPNFPTSATGNTNTIGGGTRTWTTPTNIGANDTVVTTDSLLASTTSDDLIGTGFGFAITSTDTINGILLEISYKDNSGGLGNVSESHVRLLKAGTAAGTDKSTGAGFPGTLTNVSYGGSADLWGTTWTPSDINNTNFGAAFVCSTLVSGAASTASVDYFRITVTSTAAATTKSGFLKMFSQNNKPEIRTQTRTFTR